MNTATPAIQNLARRLIAIEAARTPPNEPVDEALRACAKLRAPLAKLAGVTGFRSLMARALALAMAEVPWLHSVHVRDDGLLEGFDAASGQQGAVQRAQGGIAVVAQLLRLLVTFIGEPLTLRLVSDAWPETILDQSGAKAEGES